MDTLARLLGDSTDIKIYRPQFKRELGSTNAAILLNQVIYWWHKCGYTAFYKFKEPCNHALYNEGDSWCEELEFSKKEFDNAISKLKERKIVTAKRDNNNKVWYSVDYDQLNIFLTKVYSRKPVDTLDQGFKDNLVKIASELEHSASSPESKLQSLMNAVKGQTSPEKVEEKVPKSPLVYTPVNPLWDFTTIYQRLQQKITLGEVKLAELTYKFLPTNSGKILPEKPLKKPLAQKKENPMEVGKLTKILGGNSDMAAKIAEKMPAKPIRKKASPNAVYLAWKSSYAEVSDSFVGSLLKKEEAQLRLIVKDYPEHAAAIVEYCVHNWVTFRNAVIQSKGLANAPQDPSISFLSNYRELAHKVYNDSKGISVVVGSPHSPAAKPQDDDLPTIDKFL
ncbi:MAG: hypothetical protein RR280_04290 [Bacteroidaceae bacterium]